MPNQYTKHSDNMNTYIDFIVDNMPFRLHAEAASLYLWRMRNTRVSMGTLTEEFISSLPQHQRNYLSEFSTIGVFQAVKRITKNRSN